MSLDCYPLAPGHKIGLREQPLALDVAYEEDLLVTVVDGCQTVVIHSLEGDGRAGAVPQASFSLGPGVVIERVAYCKTGDYIACVGHQNGSLALYAAFEWRTRPSHLKAGGAEQSDVVIERLDLAANTTPIDELDRTNKLQDVDVCQRTGNLAASYGDLVIIYKFTGGCGERSQWDAEELEGGAADRLVNGSRRFVHIISVKLTIWAHAISLVENYLSLSTSDHVQVIKLELLTLQIQSDGQNDLGEAACSQAQSPANRSSSGSSGGGGAGQGRNAGASKSSQAAAAAAASASRNRRRALMGSACDETNVAASTTTGSSCCGNDTDSLMSDTDNSTATNFSAFNTTATSTCTTDEAGANSAAADRLSCATGQQPASDCSDNEPEPAGGGGGGGEGCEGGEGAANQSAGEQQLNNDSDMSIITMNNVNQNNGQQQQAAAAAASRAENSQDDCVTWNLNTKKLVKLPTLMHNTSSDLSSYHICHPLELLGPASESIACRVLARLYARDFCQNQLEPVVLLCKQFDCERAPVKSTHLQAIYLSESLDEQRRLVGKASALPSSSSSSAAFNAAEMPAAAVATLTTSERARDDPAPLLLKSAEHELLASVTCFVATLVNCFVYALHGKKVARLQTITHPGLCLDLRPDLLNVHLLTPLGLQICSTGLCDATFRYDWSSSADLNLSFLACNRARVLATARHIVLVSSSPLKEEEEARASGRDGAPNCCFIEVWRKPSLVDLFERVVHTIKRCQSISIRSNLLTYLHASAQLTLIGHTSRRCEQARAPAEPVEMLKGIAIMLCKQLLQKKQTNVITNGRIDRAIKHLLDISHCDLAELMGRHMAQLEEAARAAGDSTVAALRSSRLRQRAASMGLESYVNEEGGFGGIDSNEADENDEEDDDEEDDEEQLDCDYELLTIYLRHSKFNPAILAYLQANAAHAPACARVIAYMFDHNPRLLIKCAQRFVGANNTRPPADQMLCLNLLIERLQQLAEFDSTGINRATVLFTLANLHNALESGGGGGSDDQAESGIIEAADAEQPRPPPPPNRASLIALSQIKPLSHLAITMCSNHEIIGRSMARLVAQNYPEVFKLFLSQLAKREARAAWREFAKVQAECECELEGRARSLEGQPDLVMANRGATLRLFGAQAEEKRAGPADGPGSPTEWDEDEQFERRLRLVAELEPGELADLFLNQKGAQQQQRLDEEGQDEEAGGEDDETVEAYLRASICLLESQFILARLCESSR